MVFDTSSASLRSAPFSPEDGPLLSAAPTFPPRAGELPQGEGLRSFIFSPHAGKLPRKGRLEKFLLSHHFCVGGDAHIALQTNILNLRGLCAHAVYAVLQRAD